MVYVRLHLVYWLSILFAKTGTRICMKYSLKSSFARLVLSLLFVVLLLTVAGRIVKLTGAWAYCTGWPVCAPSAPLGWLKLLHVSFVGVASILMLIIFRKAWREQREQLVILPLTTILAVMFFGQAMVGAVLVTQSYPVHLVFLHNITTFALWISLLLLAFVGVLAVDGRKLKASISGSVSRIL
jgi:heme A synthase